MQQEKKAFLDISISICPHCETPYADASWYIIEINTEVECGKCRKTWSPRKYKVDRVLLEFQLDNKGKIKDILKKHEIE
jgi:hypothetical protein